MEQQQFAVRSERKVAQIVQNQEVQQRECVRHPSLAVRLGFCYQPVHQVNDIEEPATATVPDPAASQADRDMRNLWMAKSE